jgi:predicted metal-dependent phosphoesterase TrpH
MSWLKADLHLHTREAEPFIAFDSYRLIDRAAREGFQVLSITNHDTLTFSDSLAAYARQRGILLIPGAEATIEGRHVLLYNIDVHLSAIGTFARLRQFKGPDWLVIAAHPFFPAPVSLGKRLLDEIDVFDAIEFSHFYTETIDFNRRAATVARERGVALVGNSDTHLARQFGTTYSLIEGEPTVPCVLSAIRKGRVQVVSQPLALGEMIRIGAELVVGCLRDRTNDAIRSWVPPREPLRRLLRMR